MIPRDYLNLFLGKPSEKLRQTGPKNKQDKCGHDRTYYYTDSRPIMKEEKRGHNGTLTRLRRNRLGINNSDSCTFEQDVFPGISVTFGLWQKHDMTKWLYFRVNHNDENR